MFKFFNQIIFYFLFIQCIQSQSPERLWLKNLHNLRYQFISLEQENLEFIDSLRQNWEPISHLSLDEKTEALYYIAFYHETRYVNKDKVHLAPELQELKFAESEIDRGLIRKIDRSLSALSMIHDGYFTPDAPYSISIDSSFGKALDFYAIQSGELIADIGAGIGTDVWALSFLFPDCRFLVTELFRGPHLHLKNRFQQFDNVDFKLAKKKHTNLEGLGINRILIQSTFHHFTEKNLMLQSIKKSLADNGEVILKEATYDLAQNSLCNHSMKLVDIKEYWFNNGFELIEEMIIRKTHYLKYKVAN